MSKPVPKYQPIAGRSGGVIVEVFPVGVPGKVVILPRNVGPYQLSRDEAIRVLKQGIETLEAGQ